jgi:hypothetical protein
VSRTNQIDARIAASAPARSESAQHHLSVLRPLCLRDSRLVGNDILIWGRTGSGDLPGLQSRSRWYASVCTKVHDSANRLILKAICHYQSRTSPQWRAGISKTNRHHHRHQFLRNRVPFVSRGRGRPPLPPPRKSYKARVLTQKILKVVRQATATPVIRDVALPEP